MFLPWNSQANAVQFFNFMKLCKFTSKGFVLVCALAHSGGYVRFERKAEVRKPSLLSLFINRQEAGHNADSRLPLSTSLTLKGLDC